LEQKLSQLVARSRQAKEGEAAPAEEQSPSDESETPPER
jgi:hypothetical protein